AALMPQHQNQVATQMIYRVFDASQVFIVYHVSCDTADKQIAESLIKNDLRRHPRIGATDDDGKRMLSLRQFRASFFRLLGSHTQERHAGIFIAVRRYVLSLVVRPARMLHIASCETSIAFFEF